MHCDPQRDTNGIEAMLLDATIVFNIDVDDVEILEKAKQLQTVQDHTNRMMPSSCFA